MTKMITKFGDKLLSRLLPGSTAGACVPEAGSYCGCKCRKEYDRVVCYRNYMNCYGSCVSNGVRC
ncbi:hypothetical protein [Longispora albida]|uniref:hypothetical protein n=1 Tax=Longispora albida TaxID=203523 RepID=UPI00038112FD|nr:hypothetical protein [Longispora albida]